jgi:hypothetical protein
MSINTNTLIAELTGDLRPVRTLSLRGGFLVTAGGAVATLAFVVLGFGVLSDVLSGRPNTMFLLATGSFLMLGIAAAAAVIMMSRPRVGSNHDDWIWAVAAALVLPAAALCAGLADSKNALIEAAPGLGLGCLMLGAALGLLVGVMLTLWVRHSAPTSPHRAGLLTGIAAGSLGMFAFSFHCPHSDIYHIGLWHSLAVMASAATGRMVVPVLIRW